MSQRGDVPLCRALTEEGTRAPGRKYQEMKATEEAEMLRDRHAAAQRGGEQLDRCIVAVAPTAQLEEVEKVPKYLQLQGTHPGQVLA